MRNLRKSLIFAIIAFTVACAQKTYYSEMVPSEQPRSLVEGEIKPITAAPIEKKTLNIEEITAISDEPDERGMFDKLMAKLQTFSALPEDKAKTASPALRAETLRVGVLLPLTGKAAKTGQAMQNAAMLALLETGNKQLILQFYDTKGTPEGAEEAANIALEQGANLILGPLFSAEVKKIAGTVRNAGVNMITFSTDPSVLGDKVYSVGLLLPQQVEQVVLYACEKGYKNFAILAQSNEMGEFAYSGAKTAAESCGAGITKMGFYDPTTTDFSAAVKEILPEALLRKLEKENLKEQGYEVVEEPAYDENGNLIDENNIIFDFDAVIIADEGVRLRALGALLAYYDITPDKFKTLGISLWDDPNVKKESSLIGGWYTNLPQNGFRSFSERYRATYGTKGKIPRIASQAYDTVALISALAKSGEVSADTLTDPSGFVGVDGLFRLLPDGTSERSLEIMQVSKRGADKRINPAAKAFLVAPSSGITLRSVSLDEPTGENLPVLQVNPVKEGQDGQKTATSVEAPLSGSEPEPVWGAAKDLINETAPQN